MIIRAFERSLWDSLETVEIQLSLKATKLLHPKVFRHDVLDKVVLLVNKKSTAIWKPIVAAKARKSGRCGVMSVGVMRFTMTPHAPRCAGGIGMP